MFEMLVVSIGLAFLFTVVICWILYALTSELGGLKPAQRRVAQRHMMKYGTLALAALTFTIVLLFHGFSFLLAIGIAGGSGLLIFIFMAVPSETFANRPSAHSPSTSYCPTPYESPNFERYANSLPGLKQQLIGMLRGDRRAAHSMVLYEKSVLAGGHPEAWYWKAAIQRLERDRR